MTEWEEIKRTGIGTVLHDQIEGNIRFIIIRGRLSLCSYIGIPQDHPLAGFHHNAIPIRCHGGLSCSRKRDGTVRSRTIWPLGYYWYGWTYAHEGDCDLEGHHLGRQWLLKDVINDSQNVLNDFKKLVELVDAIQER
jgi:hypothetical protein